MKAIETYSGLFFDPLDPRPEQIALRDIAHGLSNICRFGGQCRGFYSVAEHSLGVAGHLCFNEGESARFQVLGLLHDAAEAYLGDVPTPLKRTIWKGFPVYERNVLSAIYRALDVPPPTEEEGRIVKAADEYLMAVEVKQLLPSGGQGWDVVWRGVRKEDTGLSLMVPGKAYEAFLNAFYNIENTVVEGTER